ncbi:MAG: hypothetical protein ABR514_10605 [Chthoniobacterales bacterium]
MKTNSLKILAALVAGLFAVSTTLYAQGTDSRIGSSSQKAIVAKAITKEDAAKKYPPTGSGYPSGERDAHDPSGTVASPYPPHQKYDCSKVDHGALVLDTRANKVFVRP